MDRSQPVTNPMLVGAMQLVKADNCAKHRDFFMQELLKAKFICPVIIEADAAVVESGTFDMKKDSKVSFPMLTSSEGKKYFMAFTDMAELMKWKKDNRQAVFIFRFTNYAEIILKEDSPVAGLAVNPYGDNMVIPKEMAKAIMDTLKEKEQAENTEEEKHE